MYIVNDDHMIENLVIVLPPESISARILHVWPVTIMSDTAGPTWVVNYFCLYITLATVKTRSHIAGSVIV